MNQIAYAYGLLSCLAFACPGADAVPQVGDIAPELGL